MRPAEVRRDLGDRALLRARQAERQRARAARGPGVRRRGERGARLLPRRRSGAAPGRAGGRTARRRSASGAPASVPRRGPRGRPRPTAGARGAARVPARSAAGARPPPQGRHAGTRSAQLSTALCTMRRMTPTGIGRRLLVDRHDGRQAGEVAVVLEDRHVGMDQANGSGAERRLDPAVHQEPLPDPEPRREVLHLVEPDEERRSVVVAQRDLEDAPAAPARASPDGRTPPRRPPSRPRRRRSARSGVRVRRSS